MGNFKTFVAIILVAGLVSSQGHVLKKPKGDWPLARQILGELNTFTFYVIVEINSAAYNENEEIADEMWEFINEGWQKCIHLTQIVNIELQQDRLTVEQAKIHLGEFLVIFTKIKSDITQLVSQLSVETQELINEQFVKLFLGVPEYADSFYEALEGTMPASCGFNGISVNETMIPEWPLNASAPIGQEFWRIQTHYTAGTYLMLQPHNKYLDMETPNRDNQWQLTLFTSKDFPRFMDETGIEVIHRTIMFNCADDKKTATYNFEIPLATGPLVEPTIKPHF